MELCSYNPHNCECRRQPDYKLIETDTGKEFFCCSEHERSYRDLNRRYRREYFVIVKLPASGQRTKTTAELESELSSLRQRAEKAEGDYAVSHTKAEMFKRSAIANNDEVKKLKAALRDVRAQLVPHRTITATMIIDKALEEK